MLETVFDLSQSKLKRDEKRLQKCVSVALRFHVTIFRFYRCTTFCGICEKQEEKHTKKRIDNIDAKKSNEKTNVDIAATVAIIFLPSFLTISL